MTIDLRARLRQASTEATEGIHLDHPEARFADQTGPHPSAVRRWALGAVAVAAAVVIGVVAWATTSSDQPVQSGPAQPAPSASGTLRAALRKSEAARSYVIDYGSGGGTTTFQAPDRTLEVNRGTDVGQYSLIIDGTDTYGQNGEGGAWTKGRLVANEASDHRKIGSLLESFGDLGCATGPAADGTYLVTMLPDRSCPDAGPGAPSTWGPGTLQARVTLHDGFWTRIVVTSQDSTASAGDPPTTQTVTIRDYNTAPAITLPAHAGRGSDPGTNIPQLIEPTTTTTPR